MHRTSHDRSCFVPKFLVELRLLQTKRSDALTLTDLLYDTRQVDETGNDRILK